MKKIFFIIIILSTVLSLNAQFYNGLQMNFGKNRVQYKPFNWRYFRYDDYDIYSYDRGLNLGKYAAENIDDILDEFSTYFGINLKERVLFVVYNNLTDFRQSNIGLQTGNVDFNTGGQFQILDNKVFVYYESDHQKFMTQMREVIARLYVRQILYGSAFTDKLATSTLLNVPTWFEEGLVSYVSKPYDIDVFNNVKDLLETKKHISFNHSSNDMARYIGHSFWYYIADTYGDDVIANILYFAKVSKSIKNAVVFVLGYDLKQLTINWRAYYEDKFNIKTQNLPSDDNQIKISKKKRVYQQFKVSPDGKNIAFVENYEGKYKVLLYNTETEKTQKLYKEGQRLQQIVDYSYPVVAWNHTGKILAFTTEKESNVYLWLYDTQKEEMRSFVLPYISKVLSFSFSKTGGFIVFSAVSNGFTDIFVFKLMTAQMERISGDLADDLYPTFNDDASKIIFSSNRTNDTLKKYFRYDENPPLADNFDLYFYDYKNGNNVLKRLTDTKFSNEKQVVSLGNEKYMYLTDSIGFVNRFMLKYDSVIAFVDTTVHYKFFTNTYQLTDYSKNIIEQDLNNNVLGEVLFNNKRYRMFTYRFDVNTAKHIDNSDVLPFSQTFIDKKNALRNSQAKLDNYQKLQQQKLDSLKPIFDKKLLTPDSSIVDINNYQFEIEKDTLFKMYYLSQNPATKTLDSARFPQLWVYHPTFYANDMMSQLDFSMLNQSYQPFTGDRFIFNPGMSMYTTIGIDELFENYKLLAGFRYGFSGAREYLFSIEDLEKRLDKNIIYHRQVFKDKNNDAYGYYSEAYKTITNELMLTLRYPFNQTTSLKSTFIGKYDRNISLSLDYNTLVIPDTFNVYSGAKLEYIFDNTRNLSLNLQEGMKFKIFGEFYQQVHGKYYYTSVLGADFRFYKNIFRNMIFASRFAGSTSFGTGKVIFYLGGVDNWMDLSFGTDANSYFDRSVNINTDETYLFQAVATNMRGFSQNIRNGNSFLVANNELRVPVFQMFYPYPVNSEFWYNLQVIGFFDVGSAWSGLSPYDEKNYYNKIVVNRGSFTVIVDVDRPPFVYGYGWGLRSKLFGYFVRVDWSWGMEGDYNHGRKVYFSLAKDF